MLPDDHQKWHLRSIITYRPEEKTPISALTERFTIRKAKLSHSTPKVLAQSSLAVSRTDLLRSASYVATAKLGSSVSQERLTSRTKLQCLKPAGREINELDGLAAKQGKAARRGEEDESRNNAKKHRLCDSGQKKDLASFVELDKKSTKPAQELLRVSAPLKARASTEVTFQESERLSPITPTKLQSSHSRLQQWSALQINQVSLYNITSTRSVPRQDVAWTRSMLKSPFTFDVSKWTASDPRLTQNTAPFGKSRLRVHDLEGETARVYVRYPYCQECVRQAQPIAVRLN